MEWVTPMLRSARGNPLTASAPARPNNCAGLRAVLNEMANQDYLHFLLDPDADARRQDFTTFVGPNAKAFLPAYERARAVANRAPGEKVKLTLGGTGFNVGAFFVGPVWFFYRRLWVWACGLTVALFLIGLIPGTSRIGLPVGLGLGFGANQLYVSHAITRVARMRAQGRGAPEQLAAAGGVSKVAAWIAGTVFALLMALTLYGLFTLGPDAIR